MEESFGHPGADLSNYREELSRGRSARTLSLRRVNRPTISGSLGVASNPSRTARGHISKSPQFQAFTVENTVAVLSSRNEGSIASHCQKICELSQQPKIISNIAQSEEICNLFVDVISDNIADNTKTLILSAVANLFVLSNSLRDQYVDGLAIVFLDFLESQNQNLVIQTIQVISILVDASGYARDSILSFGVQEQLVSIALAESEPSLTIEACKAIYSIYASPEEIDISIMQMSVPTLKQLFGLSNVIAMKSVILTFSELANKNPSIVYVFYNNNIYEIAIQLLHNPELVHEAIALVGNLALGKRQHVQTLLENQLFQTLVEFFAEESIRSEVLWVVSNLIESSAPMVLPLMEPAFISEILASSVDGSFEVKKETAYLISTLIIFVPTDSLPLFLAGQVADSLIEMCNCGVSFVVTRCLDAIIRLIAFVQAGNDGGEFVHNVLQSEIVEHILEIQQSEIEKAKEKASVLLSMIDALQSS